jgi:hypothetical protein
MSRTTSRSSRPIAFAFAALVGCGGQIEGLTGGPDADDDAIAADSGADGVVEDTVVADVPSLPDEGPRDTGIVPVDEGFDTIPPVDVNFVDEGLDAGPPDEGPDTTFEETSPPDVGVDTGHDTGLADSGHDTGLADTGHDTGVDTGHDAGVVDTGRDTGLVDTGHDTGIVDTGLVDSGHDAPIETGPEAGTHCGGSVCDPTSQVCCASTTGGFVCQPASTGCGGGGPTLNCSSASSCTGGDVCCFSGGIFNGTATCEPTCTGIQLCDTTAECPAGRSCVTILLGYKICQ